MKQLAVTIRKFDHKHGNYLNPSRKVLHKQMLKLHRNIKKKDAITTEYSIERDSDKTKYHSHLLIHYNNKKNLYDQLSRFIGGNGWKLREKGLETFNECNGKYGCVHTEDVRDEWPYRRYMDKKVQVKTLI